MRFFTLAAVLFFACPLAYFLLQARRDLERPARKPESAAIVFTARKGRQWLEDEKGQCIRAVLRRSTDVRRSQRHGK